MKKHINWRVNIVLFSLILIFGAVIITRLFFVQILERKLYQAQALGQQTAFNNITGSRGQIFCENSQETKGDSGLGEVKSLAINKDNWTITASPRDIKDKQVFADLLSKSISQTPDQIFADINTQDAYAVIEKNLSSEKLDEIKRLNLKGLSWQNEPNRFYPQGQMASQALGFLGGSGSGQYGVEGYYDQVLQGKTGVFEEKSGIDSIFSDNDQQSLDGSDIYLTIDYNIQFQAEQLLKQEQKKNNIDSGQIIVMKPDTGRILAMANFPNFNPNQYSKQSNMVIFQNSVMQKLFEPGSIMKPITMAAALNEGKITPDTTYVDTGVVTFGSKSIHNFANEKYGQQTMTQVLESSINTGAVFAEQQMDRKTFWNYLDKFGFFRKTGIDLQGEVYSQNSGLKSGPDINYATASFGQGIEVTPIQIARAFCAIANGGKLVKPYIVERIVSGDDISHTKPEISNPIVSRDTLSQLNTMLINVVEKGFNKVAKIPGYYFAGKTGTAQVPLLNGRGYEPDKTIQSFIGYGPAFNPQFLILIKLDNPKVPMSALSAVPLFKQLAQYIINYWQILPDYEVEK
jgi:cell division protein FtsI/penicillin-binding protein 2